MGATPHRCAHAASRADTCGLSPAATNKIAAVSIPTPSSATRSGAVARTSGARCASRRARWPRGRRPGDPASGARASSRTRPDRPRRRPQRRGGACQAAAGHTPEPFSQLVGRGEAEMADLVQALDPRVTCRTFRDQQRPDRFHVAVRRSSRSPTPVPTPPPAPLRSRRSCRTSRPGGAAAGSVGRPRSPRAPAAQIAGQARAVRAGAFHPDPLPAARTPPSQSCNARNPPVSSRTTPHPTRRRSHRPRPRHAHPNAYQLRPSPGAWSLRWSSPSLLCSTDQGVARTSREGDRDEHAGLNSELGHPPERGVPNSNATTANVAATTNTHGGPQPDTHWQLCRLYAAMLHGRCMNIQRCPSTSSTR